MNNELLTARSYLYEFAGRVLSFSEEQQWQKDREQAAFLAEHIEDLRPFLASFLSASYEVFAAERNEVFYDFSLVNVPLDASFYDEGRDNGKMRIIAAGILARAGLAKADGVGENEDTLSFTFLTAARIAAKAAAGEENPHAKEGYEALLAELFERVINPIADEFCQKLKIHKNSAIFADLSDLIAYLVATERAILAISAPAPKAHSAADAALAKKPYEPRLPTQFSKLHMEEVTAFKGMD